MSAAGITVGPPVREDESACLSLDGLRFPVHCLQEPILVYLSMPGSSVVPFRVFETDSVAAVKLKIQSFKGFVVNRQRLVCNGRELTRNHCLVRDYGVGNGKVLHLVLRLSDLLSISVSTACGKTFKLQVERTKNVGHIKHLIANRRNYYGSVHSQTLVCDGEELDDRCLLDDISKSADEDAVIHLLICKTTKVSVKPDGKDCELSIIAPEPPEEEEEGESGWIKESKLPGRKCCLKPIVGNPKLEIPPVMKELVGSSLAGLQNGNFPLRSSEGSGGVYFMQDATGYKHVAVFKPIDEEPMAVNNPQGLPLSVDGEGLKRGTRAGEGAFREVAAYILDHPISGRRSFTNDVIGFAGVPPTTMVRCLHEGFNHPGGFDTSVRNFKIGSLQKFVRNSGSCEDMGPRAFPLEEVHKISVLDIRLANVDRHGGNILISKEGGDGRMVLVPIDHGYCLPENFEDCTFEWLYWPQAKERYNSKTVNYIRSLDAEEDIALLKFHGWDVPPECARTLRISTMLLKKGVERGLTPFTIGSIMCRETVRDKSEIEKIVHEVEDAILPGSSEETFMACMSEILDRHLDNHAS